MTEVPQQSQIIEYGRQVAIYQIEFSRFRK